MTQQVVNVTEGQPLNASLGFVANSVTINNITQSWAYVSAAQQFIPPYQYGVVLNLPGTDTGDIVWQTPTSLPVGPLGSPLGTLTATYTTATLTPSNGMSVFTQQTSVVLGEVGTGLSINFTLPAGTQALMLASTGLTTVSYDIVGVATKSTYGKTNAVPSAAIVPVSPIADPVVQVNNQGFSFIVIALFTSQPEPTQQVIATIPAGVNVDI